MEQYQTLKKVNKCNVILKKPEIVTKIIFINVADIWT